MQDFDYTQYLKNNPLLKESISEMGDNIEDLRKKYRDALDLKMKINSEYDNAEKAKDTRIMNALLPKWKANDKEVTKLHNLLVRANASQPKTNFDKDTKDFIEYLTDEGVWVNQNPGIEYEPGTIVVDVYDDENYQKSKFLGGTLAQGFKRIKQVIQEYPKIDLFIVNRIRSEYAFQIKKK